MKPRISVIVPVYNVKCYLDRCINSILNQSFRDFELILVNDGSTDGSLNICKKYVDKDERVKIISQSNKGMSAARNTGLKNADGYYICFVDSDDFVEKNYLFQLLNKIKEEQADVVVCEFYFVNEDGRKNKIRKFNIPANDRNLNGRKYLEYLFKDNSDIYIVPWNKLFKRDLFNNVKFETNKYFEDEFLVVPLFWNIKKVSLLRKPLYNYVQRSGSSTNLPINLKKILDVCDFKKRRADFFKEKKEKKLFKLASQSYKSWIIFCDSEYSNFIDKKLEKLFQQEFRKYPLYWHGNKKEIIKDMIGYVSLNLIAKIRTKFIGNSLNKQK